jgi:hypothetical protein
LKVTHNGRLHDGEQRVDRRRVPGLARWDAQAFAAPVDIVQGQGRGIASLEAIGRQQEYDGITPPAAGRPTVKCLQQEALRRLSAEDRPV